MKLAYTRIVTNDVPALAQFYKEITGIAPVVFNDAYVEFPNSGTVLAISSQQNRSMLFRDPDGNLINFFAPIRDAAN